MCIRDRSRLIIVNIASPQNQAPITVRYMDQKYIKDFLKALDEAKKRLAKPDCAKLFGKSSADLIKMLENTEYRVNDLGSPKYDSTTDTVSVVGAQTNSATSVWINEKGPFFNHVSYTHLRAHETPEHLVCRLLLE